MRLLLDVHHSPAIAAALSATVHDVVAAAADPVLATSSDEELLRAGANDVRAVVTENAADLDRIARAWAARGEHHAGVVNRDERATPPPGPPPI